MSERIELSVLIVTHGRPELAVACVDSVLRETVDVRFEVIVVDAASADETAEILHRRFPQVDVVALPTNVGFARAANLAASRSRGEHLVLLNPDVIVRDHALTRLLTFALRHPEYGVYGGRTVSPDETLDPMSCWGAPTLWSTLCFATGLSAAFRGSALFDPESLGPWRRDSVREVPIVTGCMMMLSRLLWERLGGFDERFFLYGEDVDLSLRAAAVGCRPVITPEATVVHVSGASTASAGRRMTLVLCGRVTVVRKHWPPTQARLGALLLLAGVAMRAVAAAVGVRRLAPQFWREVWRARGEWSRGYPAPCPQGVGETFAGTGS